MIDTNLFMTQFPRFFQTKVTDRIATSKESNLVDKKFLSRQDHQEFDVPEIWLHHCGGSGATIFMLNVNSASKAILQLFLTTSRIQDQFNVKSCVIPPFTPSVLSTLSNLQNKLKIASIKLLQQEVEALRSLQFHLVRRFTASAAVDDHVHEWMIIQLNRGFSLKSGE